MDKDFETALEELVDEHMEGGASRADIISALEERLAALKEEEAASDPDDDVAF